MLDQIEKLLVLQDRDQRMSAIALQKKAVPVERAQIERQLAEAEASLDSLKARIRENEVALKTLEVEAQSKRDAIARYKGQQLATRKNEEFSALANEIRRAETDITELEDREIELMEGAEKLRTSLAEADAGIASTRADLKARMEAVNSRLGNLEAQEAEVEKERAQLASAVDPEIRDIYERIFKKKGDAGLAGMSSGVCGGCHMKVSANTAIAVKNGADLVTCDQCGRILYLKD